MKFFIPGPCLNQMPQGKIELKSSVIMSLIGIIFFICAFMGHGTALLAQSLGVGIIQVDRLNFRSKPDLKSHSYQKLEKGTRVKIIKSLSGWLKISHAGKVGYVIDNKKYVKILEQNENKTNKSSVAHLKKESQKINHELKSHKNDFAKFKKKETAIIDALNKIDFDLNTTRKQILKIKSEINAIEKKLKENKIKHDELVIKIQTGEKHAGKRVVAIYKLNNLGRINFIASAESIQELFLRQSSLERILAYDHQFLQTLANNKVKLAVILDLQKTQFKKKILFEKELENNESFMSVEKSKRTEVLGQIRKKKEFEIAAIRSLQQAAQELNQQIKNYDKSIVRSSPDPKGFQLSFPSLKGLLNIPVKGKIISYFGPYTNKKLNIKNSRNGIEIRADIGEPIHSVYSGKILFSSWFKGFGNIIIINHGGNYYSVYAHIHELFKTEGDYVETGEVIATVGDTGSIIGPVLYFELRHRGIPMDPLKWIKTG